MNPPRLTIRGLMALIALTAGWLALFRYPIALIWFLAILHTMGIAIWVNWRAFRPPGTALRGLPEKAANLLGRILLVNWILLPLLMAIAAAMAHSYPPGMIVCLLIIIVILSFASVLTSIVLYTWITGWPTTLPETPAEPLDLAWFDKEADIIDVSSHSDSA